jgi:hypothetical protein
VQAKTVGAGFTAASRSYYRKIEMARHFRVSMPKGRFVTQRNDAAPAYLEIIPAAQEQASILADLLELYAHDFSEFHDLDRLGTCAYQARWPFT